MRSLIALIFTALALNLAASFAAASCLAESVAEHAQRAELIAYGRLNGDRFEIRQVLKGTGSGTITVRLGPQKGAVTSVDYMTVDGTDNTLYLWLEDGEWVTNSCSGSHPGVPTPEERELFALGTDGEVWTMGGGSADDVGGGSGQLDGNVTASISNAVLFGGLAAVALAAIAAVSRLRRTTA
jgi:hypothetical protein